MKKQKITKKQRQSKIRKEERKASLLESAASAKCEYNIQEINLETNKIWCEKITQSACWRPDIYLNNDKTCDKCALAKNCVCQIKNFSKAYKI